MSLVVGFMLLYDRVWMKNKVVDALQLEDRMRR
jgi:hypothetical protein